MKSESFVEFYALKHRYCGVSVGMNDKSRRSLIVQIIERREALVNLRVFLSGLVKDVLVVSMRKEINVSIHVDEDFHM
jgi:hypothetical protein